MLHPRVLIRAGQALGVSATLRLISLRLFGSPKRRYKVRLRGHSHPVYLRGGRSTDATTLYEVMVTQEYAFQAALDSPAFIIDGGANVGMASVFFLNRYPSAQVIAIEPDPANFDLCRQNLAPYEDRATVIQGAIWKKEGHLALEPNEQEWLVRVRDDRPGSVRAVTMSSLMADASQVDILKLDIEGAEGEVFASGAPEWLSRVRNIAIELHGERNKAAFFDALKGYRYELSMHCTWSDPAGPAGNCYLAICRNLNPEAV